MENTSGSPLEMVIESYKGHKEVYHNVGAAVAGMLVFSGGVAPAIVGVVAYQVGKRLYHNREEKKK